MNDLGEEEIDAELEPSGGLKIPSLAEVLEKYGWCIVISFCILYFLYKKVIEPLMKAAATERELEERKKFDAQTKLNSEARMQAAREAMLQKYTADALKAKEREEQRRLEKVLGETAAEEYLSSKPTTSGKHRTFDQNFTGNSFVEDTVAAYPVVVFSASICPPCQKTKRALSIYRLPPELYRIVEVDLLNNRDNVMNALESITGFRSVPRVFIGGSYVGGCDEILEMQRNGKLDDLLKSCGVLS
ncbi:hypothetical protein AB6A40_000354 [Gnathostoma spinigerum]|uniref:Glutaredoxin domain-containing protein n=1 Tax=Gnathostoma spinigerum TaxID=75299 RepID=A0ABD6E2W2_9BILA